MKRLALIAIAICVILPAGVALAFTSPLVSPLLSPLPHTPTPTPTHEMIPYEDTVDLEDATPSPDYCPGGCKPTATPTPAAEWLRDDLWMGKCRMWTDGYRVTRVECP